MKNKVFNTEKKWRSLLGVSRYKICRQGETEPAFRGDLWDLKDAGTYTCACCNHLLFNSDGKYTSGGGWPSFSLPVSESRLQTRRDTSNGIVRTEILCSSCDSHLGHVFKDTCSPSGTRYCVNSASLRFHPKETVPVH